LIYERDSSIPLFTHDIRFAADPTGHLVDAGKYLQDLVAPLIQRIGVFQLERDEILILKPNIELLNAEHEMLFFDIYDSSRQAIITGNACFQHRMSIR
jgi:hypothetical protein